MLAQLNACTSGLDEGIHYRCATRRVANAPEDRVRILKPLTIYENGQKEKDALRSGQLNKGLCLSRNNPLHKYRVYNNHFSSYHGEKDLVL